MYNNKQVTAYHVPVFLKICLIKQNRWIADVQPRNLNPVKISKGAPSINIEISMQEAAQR